MKVKINLNPQTLEEAVVSYSVLRGSYMETRKLFPELEACPKGIQQITDCERKAGNLRRHQGHSAGN